MSLNILDEETRAKLVTDNWQIRRRWMKYSLLWMGGNVEALVAWVIVTGGTSIGLQIIMTLIGAIVAILMFYIFGATWDDHSKRTLIGNVVGSGESRDCDEKGEK